MNSRPLTIALGILLFSLALFVLRDIHFSNPEIEAPGEQLLDQEPLMAYLRGHAESVNFQNIIKNKEHVLDQIYWKALKFMDHLLVRGKKAEALAFRHRLRFLSDFVEQSFKRTGYIELVAVHADIIYEGDQRVHLDSDIGRANRRISAANGLEAFWEGRQEEGFLISQTFSQIHADDLQTVEAAYALRLRREILSRDRDNISPQNLTDIHQWIQWGKDHPAALVQAEWAFLVDEVAVSGFSQQTLEEDREAIIQAATLALKGQAPQKIDLLELMLRVTSWDIQEQTQLQYYVCDYLEVVADRITPRLFRQVWNRLIYLEKHQKAQSWLQKILVNKEKSPFYGVALHLKALQLQKENRSPREIFEIYNQALEVLKDPHSRADLLVDIGHYERSLSKDQADEARAYMKQALARFQEAVKLDPDHLAARLNLSTVTLRYGGHDHARQWLTGIDLRRAPANYKAIAYLNWAQILAVEKKHEEAYQYYEMAKDHDPNLPGLKLVLNQIQQIP